MGGLTLRNKSAEVLNRPKNPELEMDFRKTRSAPQINPSLYDPPLMQAYRNYLNTCQIGTSLYSIWKVDKKTNLYIYNTETDTQEVIILQTPKPLDYSACISQLPNGKLFCFGDDKYSRTTVLVDRNGGVEVLPSGIPIRFSSCIYFNKSVYCFGGQNKKTTLTLSCRFDLDQNRWIQLTPMPGPDFNCNSIMLDRNILISGYIGENLLLYSIDIDSFSAIPFWFEIGKRKILINADRLYLIKCNEGAIYECEIGSYMNWRPTGRISIITRRAWQVYCSYNKGGIYIGIEGSYFFKFDLNKKRLIELKMS
ncbi:unnamed protein product [Blepharisma stoltei]|uniref:Uncharacterized protein n=1 Tax=Blepharisma stoltei TaxID=1481888 RepID=A0AAU9K837_9CILI|nr:unnamed protein product [Blepharisma stoltei]